MRTQKIVFLRKLASVMLFVCLTTGAFAKPPHWAPAFGYHKKHHYVYYPKQNFYYDPYLGTYIVYERGVWVRQVSPPRIFASININILPHVDLHIASFYPYYYNEEHCHRDYLVSALAPPTEYYVYRYPRRHDFSITPYAYYRPNPNVEISVAFYNPNYYLHPEYGPHPHHPGKGHGHAYGHYKHGDWYGYDHRGGPPHHGDWDRDPGHGKGHYEHGKQRPPVNRPPDKWESPNSHAKGSQPKRPDLFKGDPNPDRNKQQGPGKPPKKVDHQQSQPHPVMVARDNGHGKQGGYGGNQNHGQPGGGRQEKGGGHGGGKGKHGKN